MKNECSNCKFALHDSGAVFCRRFPPQVVHHDGKGDFCTFPWVQPTAWCGEYKAVMIKKGLS